MDTLFFQSPIGLILLGYAIGITLALMMRNNRSNMPYVAPVVLPNEASPEEGAGCITFMLLGLVFLALLAYLSYTQGWNF